MRRGTTFVNGTSPELARTLLDAATEVGLPEFVVRYTDGGFVVPDAVWDAASESLTGIPAEAF